MRFGGVRSL
jgi:ribosomal protein L24